MTLVSLCFSFLFEERAFWISLEDKYAGGQYLIERMTMKTISLRS